ncbi:hypothetical protein HOLleu_10156 [Holothuria leucospilota]|uniref:DUF4806 domain-containing protein n=1 Tax=Holothuria leucospilota TaxID=206669 RepID=A0A9Q1CDS1_HOLLE|nr:hypothetical protein HOLleu_10156 [Holothuria leucospilota]
MEQLEELDRQLKINRELHRHLLSILSATGGKRLREVIRRMMTELITNEVAKKTNWTGQGGKTSFSALALRALVEKAVRRNSSTAGCSNAEVKAEVGYFLKGASDRDGGRQARRQPAQPQPEVAAEQ